MASVQPNQTVYINNLNEKIKKDALKKSIYSASRNAGLPFFDKPMRIALAKRRATPPRPTVASPRKRKREAPPPKAPPATEALEAPKPAKAAKADKNATPPNVLFAQDLPDDCNDMMLSILFQQYGGFKEVRMVPGKKGIAFVEFADETQASLALQGLDNFKLTPTDTLALSFAKR
ncbi:hypothetical protein JL720_11890 [Aureococcus anophagefferens]|nr:hypothetical protein JL720_11890 [Aureococcus anophagefferens]